MIDAQLAQTTEPHKPSVALGKAKAQLRLDAAKLFVGGHRLCTATVGLTRAQNSLNVRHRVKLVSV